MKFDNIPYIKVNSHKEIDIEKIMLNKNLFEDFQKYIQSAYNFCSKTNPFTPYTYEKVHNIKDRTAFQQFIGLVSSNSHGKILDEALEKECKVHLHFVSPKEYMKIESKLKELSEDPILDSNHLKFGFSEDEEMTQNTAKAIIHYKRDLIRNPGVTNKNNQKMGLK